MRLLGHQLPRVLFRQHVPRARSHADAAGEPSAARVCRAAETSSRTRRLSLLPLPPDLSRWLSRANLQRARHDAGEGSVLRSLQSRLRPRRDALPQNSAPPGNRLEALKGKRRGQQTRQGTGLAKMDLWALRPWAPFLPQWLRLVRHGWQRVAMVQRLVSGR